MVRKDYIQTLKDADRGDYTPLVEFMKRFGARNPTLSEWLTAKFYQTYIHGEKGLAMMNALLRSGGNPNDQTPSSYRLLQLAVKAVLEDIVNRLVIAGVEVDVQDRSGLTPFQVAVMKENKPLADFLASKGAQRQPPPGLGYVKYL